MRNSFRRPRVPGALSLMRDTRWLLRLPVVINSVTSRNLVYIDVSILHLYCTFIQRISERNYIFSNKVLSKNVL